MAMAGDNINALYKKHRLSLNYVSFNPHAAGG